MVPQANIKYRLNNNLLRMPSVLVTWVLQIAEVVQSLPTGGLLQSSDVRNGPNCWTTLNL